MFLPTVSPSPPPNVSTHTNYLGFVKDVSHRRNMRTGIKKHTTQMWKIKKLSSLFFCPPPTPNDTVDTVLASDVSLEARSGGMEVEWGVVPKFSLPTNATSLNTLDYSIYIFFTSFPTFSLSFPHFPIF